MYKKLVLIDFSWLYNKYFFVAKQQNSKEELKGNLTSMLCQFLKRIENSYEKTKVLLVLDCALSTTENIKLNENYKQNRDKESKKEVYSFLKDVINELSYTLPKAYEFIKAKGYEADQVIAYLANKYHNTYPVIIYSGDKDLIQLTYYSNVYISDKFERGQFLVKSDKEIFEKFKNSKGENFTRISKDKRDILKYRTLKGDPSDNLPAVFSRIKDTDIVDIVKNYWKTYEPLNEETIENIIEDISKDNNKLAKKLKGSTKTWLTNYKIMNLYNISISSIISKKD